MKQEQRKRSTQEAFPKFIRTRAAANFTGKATKRAKHWPVSTFKSKHFLFSYISSNYRKKVKFNYMFTVLGIELSKHYQKGEHFRFKILEFDKLRYKNNNKSVQLKRTQKRLNLSVTN